ncbi:MAG: NYN domain-containing protein [Cryobacterium sp.]|nr:NYN domain-containing protein [Cryobacterium sp.]
MQDPDENRVAVYIDFDNIVISRYEEIHGRGSFSTDGIRNFRGWNSTDTEKLRRFEAGKVDLGAVLDYSSSFGTVAISRAYADWSASINASYKDQLVGRAVELIQMFPTVASMKNGADIRMSVDVIEDLFRLPELTHVVIVSGDSDFIALVQRCRRLGRYVVGIGVAGATSRSLNAACDEYKDYDALPGLEVTDVELDSVPPAEIPVTPVSSTALEVAKTPDQSATKKAPASSKQKAVAKPAPKTPSKATAKAQSSADVGSANGKSAQQSQRSASKLLVRALGIARSRDEEWVLSSVLKNHILRMDPTFQESSLGYKTFTDFVKSRGNLVDVREEGQVRWIRLRESAPVSK